MQVTKKPTSFYIKTGILSTLLFLESFFLSRYISKFVEDLNFFKTNIDFMLISGGLIVAVLVTTALLTGAWNKWEQYVFTPLPISAGMFFVLFPINSAYAIAISIAVAGFLVYDVSLASSLRDKMLKFSPRLVLKFTSKGLIFSFSLLATVLVLLSVGKEPKIDIGESIGNLAQEQLAPHINNQINAKIKEGMSEEQLEMLSTVGLEPTRYPTLTAGLLEKLAAGDITAPDISIQKTVTQEVNKIIEPYKRFFNPLMAVIMFGLMQFIGSIAMLVYTIIIDAVFYVAKKTGMLKISKVQVEKEILHF